MRRKDKRGANHLRLLLDFGPAGAMGYIDPSRHVLAPIRAHCRHLERIYPPQSSVAPSRPRAAAPSPDHASTCPESIIPCGLHTLANATLSASRFGIHANAALTCLASFLAIPCHASSPPVPGHVPRCPSVSTLPMPRTHAPSALFSCACVRPCAQPPFSGLSPPCAAFSQSCAESLYF